MSFAVPVKAGTAPLTAGTLTTGLLLPAILVLAGGHERTCL